MTSVTKDSMPPMFDQGKIEASILEFFRPRLLAKIVNPIDNAVKINTASSCFPIVSNFFLIRITPVAKKLRTNETIRLEESSFPLLPLKTQTKLPSMMPVADTYPNNAKLLLFAP